MRLNKIKYILKETIDGLKKEQIRGIAPIGSEATGSCHDMFPYGLEDYANSLGIQSGTPGVDDTIMTAADQFCIKCQADSWMTQHEEACECCETDYTYDNNTISFSQGKLPIDKKQNVGKGDGSETEFGKKPRTLQELKRLISKLITEEHNNNQITEKKFSVLDWDGMNDHCLGCSACCGVTATYENWFGVTTHLEIECMSCGCMPVGTVFDQDGNPMGAPGEKKDKSFTTNSTGQGGGRSKLRPLQESSILLTEEKMECHSFADMAKCVQFAKDCLAGGEIPCTNPSENNANGYITVYCGCGGLPGEISFDNIGALKQYHIAFNSGEAVGGGKGDTLGANNSTGQGGGRSKLRTLENKDPFVRLQKLAGIKPEEK